MLTSKKIHIYAAVVLVSTLVSYGWVARSVYDSATRGYADFSVFYAAGKIVQRGQGHQLYDLELQTRVQKEFSEPAILRNRALPYMRLPFEALLFVPFSYLSYIVAYRIWVGLYVLTVLLAAALLRRKIPELKLFPAWLYFPAYLGYFPLAYGMALGQDSGLMLLFFVCFILALREQKDFRAGCFIGLALIKFQLVLPILFVLTVKKHFRVLAGFSVVAWTLAGISAWVTGVQGLMGYPTYLWRLNRVPATSGIFPNMMPSIRGLVEGWVSPMHSFPALDILTSALSATLLLWTAMQWRTESPRSSKIYTGGVLACVVAAMLSGYHTFAADLSLLCPVVLLAACAAWRAADLDFATRSTLWLGAGGLLFTPFYLLLIWEKQLNLMVVFPCLLIWGLARATKTWSSIENPA